MRFAKHPRSGFRDALAILRCLLPTHLHLSLSLFFDVTLDILYDDHNVNL
jgi:hypothetical protein